MLDKLKNISFLARKFNRNIYLTGGAVRDFILDFPINDYDFAVENNTREISYEFSKMISGKFIELDDKHNIYRIAKNGVEYDFTEFKGKNITEDLLKRDFSINALAISHNDFSYLNDISEKSRKIRKEILLDPANGKYDIKNSIIRALNSKIFVKDPIRLLRAIRFKAELGFNIEKNTEKMIIKNKKLINKSASERVHDELIKIFSSEKSFELIKYMEDKLGLFSEIFPEIDKLKITGKCRYHNEDVWVHSLDMLKLFEEFSKKNKISYFPDGNEIPLMKFAILFHDYGKIFSKTKENGVVHYYGHEKIGSEKAGKILLDLKFSKNEIKYIKTLVRYHMQPLYFYTDKKVSNKAIYNFFKKVGDLAPDIIFISALDVGSTRRLNGQVNKAISYWEYINTLLNKYYNMQSKLIEPLLNGKEIMEILDIKEGPKIGNIIEKLKEAQALGKVEEKDEAIKFIIKEFN